MTQGTVSHLTSAAERERRYAALRSEMARTGFDALVICSRGDEFVRGRVQYVSDIFQWAGRGFVVLPRVGDPVFVGDPLWGLGYARRSDWIVDLRLPTNAGAEIAAILADLGADRGSIGVVGLADITAVADYDSIRGRLPQADLGDATDLFDDVRAIKSDEEIANLYQTSAILRSVFRALEAEIRPGLTERQVLAQAHRLARQYGCLEGIALMGRAPFLSFAPGTDGVIERGDIVVIDLEWGGPSGYWVELRRCFSFGPPPDHVRRFWDIRVETFAACVESMKPGAISTDILAARDRVYARHGLDAEGLVSYTAHGIGVDSLEPPWVPGKDRVLAEGMVINLHPSIRLDNPDEALAVGGVSLADNVLVAGDGGRRMTDVTDEWVTLLP